VTISVAILVSGFVSLTLTPMLCSRFLRPMKQAKHGFLYMALEHFFEGLLHVYERSLKFVLRHRLATFAASLLILAATVQLFRQIPKGFLPSEDTGQIFAFTEAQEGISFEAMAEHQKKLAAILLKDPRVESFMSSAGGGGPTNSANNTGRLFAHLIPREKRPHVDQIIQEWRVSLGNVPGIRAFLQNLPPIRIGGQLTKSLYQFTLQGPDIQQLYAGAQALEKHLRDIPILQDVTTDLQIKNPQVNIELDRDKASALGLTAQQIEDALYTAYGARQISTIYAAEDQYRVIMELNPAYQRDASALSLLYLRTSKGTLAPLDTVARIRPTTGPLSINHLGQLPAVTLSFNLKPDVALGDAVQAVQQAALDVLPTGISTSFQGTAQAFESSQAGLGIVLLISILVIYIILGILYENFLHPLTILSGLPSAGVGALATLMLFKVDLNLYAFVGVIMLVGIVKKNAIMMIDFALEAQGEGMAPRDAIYRGCVVRFRPIMMTTMAALMGTLPIALGFGAGAESRRPLGLAVVGGLLFSQLVTLYLTPVFYLYMESLQAWFNRTFRPGAASEAAASGHAD